jgi:hypothetical protein
VPVSQQKAEISAAKLFLLTLLKSRPSKKKRIFKPTYLAVELLFWNWHTFRLMSREITLKRIIDVKMVEALPQVDLY